jgi:hypothetical protein
MMWRTASRCGLDIMTTAFDFLKQAFIVPKKLAMDEL